MAKRNPVSKHSLPLEQRVFGGSIEGRLPLEQRVFGGRVKGRLTETIDHAAWPSKFKYPCPPVSHVGDGTHEDGSADFISKCTSSILKEMAVLCSVSQATMERRTLANILLFHAASVGIQALLVVLVKFLHQSRTLI